MWFQAACELGQPERFLGICGGLTTGPDGLACAVAEGDAFFGQKVADAVGFCPVLFGPGAVALGDECFYGFGAEVAVCRTRSRGSRLWLSISMRSPARKSSGFLPESWP